MLTCDSKLLQDVPLAFSPAGMHHHKQQEQQQALVTLEQALAPRARPPGPVAHLVRGLCGRVLQNMMADLRKEVQRRQEVAGGSFGSASTTVPGHMCGGC